MLKNIVIVDIDGCISKVGDRLKYLQQDPKDWDSFYADCFDDEPIQEVLDLVQTLFFDNYHTIVFCTGRRECVRVKTMAWIDTHSRIDPKYCRLLMRKNGDLRGDVVVKPELLREAGIDFNQIAFVIEDRNCMVKKWRELGLICLQCAEGNF